MILTTPKIPISSTVQQSCSMICLSDQSPDLLHLPDLSAEPDIRYRNSSDACNEYYMNQSMSCLLASGCNFPEKK